MCGPRIGACLGGNCRWPRTDRMDVKMHSDSISKQKGTPMSVESPLSEQEREFLRRASADFSAGRYLQAVESASRLSRLHPRLQAAHKLLGSALHLVGRSEEAVAALETATRLSPDDAQAWSNLGNALAAIGKHEEATAAHWQALAIEPGNATLRYNLGCLLLERGRQAEALEQFWQSYECAPGDTDSARLCREILADLGDMGLAERFCRINLMHTPDDPGALAMLGGLLLQRGLSSEAEPLLRAALQHEPANAAIWSNLCVALRVGGRLQEAMVAGQRAVELAPDWAQGCNNLGVALRDAGHWRVAKDVLLRAIHCDPSFPDPYYNLGCTCADLGEGEIAREAFIEGVKRRPRIDWVLQAAHACRQVADWEGAELLEQEFLVQFGTGDSLEEGVCPSPFACLATPGVRPADQLAVAQRLAATYASRTRLTNGGRVGGAPRLKVGLLSSDFRDHATAHLLVGVLELLDPARVQIVAYDHGPEAQDDYRSRLQRAVPEWIFVGEMSDLEAAQRIRADGIDIAIDLKGWTQGYRAGILAHRPAPLQMQWLGFPGTMGAPWIDYIIADDVTVPEGAEAAYTEKILRLPGCYQPNDRLRAIAPTPARAELGLPPEALVLAAFHQPYKITREVFAVWMRLLARVSSAVLWLLDPPAEARTRLIEAAQAAGVDPGRLVWAPRVSADAHLGRLAAADIALDAFPVGAHTTASDALWAGVPQFAQYGESFVSRVLTSIVRAAGMPELVASNEAGYEALVLDLILDRARLLAIRQRVCDQRLQCALFDTQSFAQSLTRGLELAWERSEAGQPPDHIVVPH